MARQAYKDRYISTYLTKDGLMEEVKRYCERYGYSFSKLAQAAIVEKMEREREKEEEAITGVGGMRATKLATPATPTPTPNPTTIRTFPDNGGPRS
jgi:hypothetical protein